FPQYLILKPLEWTFFVAPFNFSSYKLETGGIIHAYLFNPSYPQPPLVANLHLLDVPPLSTRALGTAPPAMDGQTLVCPSTIHATDRLKSVPPSRAVRYKNEETRDICEWQSVSWCSTCSRPV